MTPELDDQAREGLRRARVAAAPGWYSPWLHLASSLGLGGGLALLAVSRLHRVTAWELGTIPLVFLFCNAVEWKAHKGLLHRRVRYLEAFYDRHTPVHHRIFLEHDMAIRSPNDFGFVLIPWYGTTAVFAITLPITAALAWLAGSNVAALFVATSMAYIVLYECLHLAYHLPRESFIGGLGVIGILRRHHATHHRPALTQAWNFNVTVPLCDAVMGTRFREGAAKASPEAGSEQP